MKKIVLVTVCGLIITVFIAFNYLLLDRERFEGINESKNATIDAFSRQIKSLNDDNKQLSSRISELEYNSKLLQDQKDRLVQDQTKQKDVLDQKNEIINVLKRQVDTSPMDTVIRKWVDFIDKGQYDAAYDLMYKSGPNLDKLPGVSDFTNTYKSSVKNMQVKAVALNTEGVTEERKGDIVFKVTLDVKRVETDTRNLFVEGANDRYFSLAYDKNRSTWAILDITTYP